MRYMMFFLMFFAYGALPLSAQFLYLGLGTTITTDLTLCADTLYASTYDGIWKKSIASSDSAWAPCGLQGNHVVQTLVPDPLTFISAVEIGNTHRTRIHKSVNGGASFFLLLPDTSLADNYQYLDHLAHPGNNCDTLYSLNHMKKTFDGGLTWLPVGDYSVRFIKVHPIHHNQVFVGGENLIFSAELKQSLDFGDVFSYVSMTGYFAGDNTVHDMEFAGNRWIAAGEGVIAWKDNTSTGWTQAINTWSYPSPFAMYILDLEKSGNGGIYASGEIATASRVGLFVSGDEGTTWDTISFPALNYVNPSVKCIAVHSGNSIDDIFFGGHGVYLYKRNLAFVDEGSPQLSGMKVVPNPLLDGHFKILSDNPFGERILHCTLFDMTGRKVELREDGKEQWCVSHKGTFLLHIMTSKRALRQLIVNL